MRLLPKKTLAGLLLAAAACAPVHAADPLVTFKSLEPGVALEVARAAMASCRDQGYQVTVAVVDRMGVVQVLLRDRFAGALTVESAMRKAATATSFRQDTMTAAGATTPESEQSGARFIEGALMLGGGVPVSASGSIVGGIGVAGAPSGRADHECAAAGIASVSDRLELAD